MREAIVEDAIRREAHVIDGGVHDHDALLELVGDARFVLLGEATHGTEEFYRERARITERLVQELGFNAIAVEADWPDAYRVNRYVQGVGGDRTAAEALDGFRRFPTWMWRNTAIVDLVEWLCNYNGTHDAKAGFYGLDLYSMFTSIEEVLRYLDRVDPAAASLARLRYGCFDHYHEDSQRYGYAAGIGMSASCEREVIAQLRDLQLRGTEYARHEGNDAFFTAQQNARLVMNAEEYYRTMFRGRVSSWNLRDRHMAETLEALDDHLARAGMRPRIVVWEHNSHIGDARATEVGRSGEWNVGQLAREQFGNQVRLIGFTTYEGSVMAAAAWDEAPRTMRVSPALPHSVEALFHQTGIPRFMLSLREDSQAAAALQEARLERAIGVVYLPHSERHSHYFHASVAQQFDAVIHIERSSAVQPLDAAPLQSEEPPETYPSGF